MRTLFLFALLAACGGKEAGVDASVSDAGSDASDAASCVYRDTRTAADRKCTTGDDCVTAPFQRDCCTQQYAGIRKDASQKFVNDQKTLQLGCPGCGCLAKPVDDMGMSGGAIVARCDMGVCTSHAQ